MATVEGVQEVRRLDNSHPHKRVVTVAWRQPLTGKSTTLHHHLSTIILPKQEKGFTPHGSPNLGKTARVISTAPPYVTLLFVQRDSRLSNQQGAILEP